MKRLLLSTLILASVQAYAGMDLTDSKTEKEFELYGVSTNAQMKFNEAYQYSHFASYSGKYVAFQSSHTHNYDNAGKWGHYIKNTLDNSIIRVPAPEGMDDTAFSRMLLRTMTANGRFLVLEKSGYNDTLIYLYDLKTGKAKIINRDINGNIPDTVMTGFQVAVSEDGKYVYYSYYGSVLENSSSQHYNIYLWDVANDTRTRINNDSDGNIADFTPAARLTQRSISGDGRYLTYRTLNEVIPGTGKSAIKLAYIYDRVTKKSRLLSKDPETGNPKENSYASISIDGKYATYMTNKVVKAKISDNISGQYINMEYNGVPLKNCRYPSISENGLAIAFTCNNLAYFYDAIEQKIHLASISPVDGKAHSGVIQPAVLDNGSGMVWRSKGAHLLEGEPTSPDYQIYLYRQKPGTTAPQICFSDDY